jgi:phosphoenolpyruvate synthase/pyruvate phosphate dikinase
MFVDLANYANLDKVGNKAKSLMHLKNNGFWVPDGFVLDGDVYDEIINCVLISIKKMLRKLALAY